MQNQSKERMLLVKTALAVVASTALATVLLLGLPAIIFAYGILLVLVSNDNPVIYSNSIVPIFYILGGSTAFLPGLILNVILMRTSTFLYKIISIVLYIVLLAGIAFLLTGYFDYQFRHFKA